MGVFAQQTPPSRPRSGSTFTQIDDYLSVIKRLGIPTADSDVLDGLTSGPNTAKIVYNTTLNKLRVYNPVTAQWRDAIEADLTNYYTKSEVDALIAPIDVSKFVKVNEATKGRMIYLHNANGSYKMSIGLNGDGLNISSEASGNKTIYNMSNSEIGYKNILSGNGSTKTISATIGANLYGVNGLILLDSTIADNNAITKRKVVFSLSKEASDVNLVSPSTTGKYSIPVSVNGVKADNTGNITIPIPSSNFVKVDGQSNITNNFKLTSPYWYNFTLNSSNNTPLLSYVASFHDSGIFISEEYVAGRTSGIDNFKLTSYQLKMSPSRTRSAVIRAPIENNSYVYLPEEVYSYTQVLTTSVNGVAADKFGNITLPATDLQSVVNVGNKSSKEIIITGREGEQSNVNGLHLLTEGAGQSLSPAIYGVVDNRRSSSLNLGSVPSLTVSPATGGAVNVSLYNTSGLTYSKDLSPGYTDRSLVDKAYVDNRVQLVTLRGAISGGVAVLDGGPVQTGYRYLVQGACLYSLSGVSPEVNYTPEFISLNKLSIQSGMSGNVVAKYETTSADNGKEVEVLILKIKQ